jgi:Ca2+-binding EF-hand superfamily protein
MERVFSRGLLFSLCLLLAASTGALAGSIQGDANRDGRLTCSEATAQSSERFGKMDTGKNKALSMDEMESGMTGIHKEMDTDRDGLVNVEEYLTYWCGAAPEAAATTGKATAKGSAKPLFKKMDANKDGSVSPAECVALWTVRFNDADSDKDGKLTAREYTQGLIMWFGDMDVNKDSSVTVTEWTSYWVGKCDAEKMKKALDKK